MNIPDEAILNRALSEFAVNFEHKFRTGMRKYKTPLSHKDAAKESLQEVYDLFAYLTANRMVHEYLANKADDLLGRVIIQPELREFLEEIAEHLGPHHLAKKITEESEPVTSAPSLAFARPPTSESPLQPLLDLVFAGDNSGIAGPP